MAELTHAYLPPSGASAWSKCAMWPSMNARFPQESSPESLEGTAAHWVATEMLEGRFHSEGTPTPHGVIVTDEMIDGAILVVGVIQERLSSQKIHVEETISMSDLHPSCFGTPDFWSTTGHTHHIEIVDYKFGHRFVDEYFNPQGLCYLAGILQAIHGSTDKVPTDTTVTFTIVQPRCFYKGASIRSHSFTLVEATPYARSLKEAADAASVDDPVATTNPSCIDCPGRHSCAALQQAAYSDAETSTDRTSLDISPEAAALELRMLSRSLERLEARVEGLRELTTANLKAGKRLPYYHLEQGYGRLQWNSETTPAEILSLGELYGKNLSKSGLITPTQAKKLGVDEDVIMIYAVKPMTAVKLVQDNPSDARKVFG